MIRRIPAEHPQGIGETTDILLCRQHIGERALLSAHDDPGVPRENVHDRRFGAARSGSADSVRHLVLVLFAGDYRDASHRKRAGLPDRYRHHSYALASLEALCAQGDRVTVVQVHSDDTYDEQDDGGIRFLGLGGGAETVTASRLAGYLGIENASHVMLRFPSTVMLRAILPTPARVSVVLADSFPARLRNFRRYRALGSVLRDPRIDFVSNHHLRSTRQLVGVLGVDPSRAIPWDWPLDLLETARRSAKARPCGLKLCYAGRIDKSKGVWDLISAMKLLHDDGEDVSLEVAGAGQVDELWRRIESNSLGDRVTHHGRIGGDAVLAMMQRSAFVCVPSRHSYPEGLPLTIFEAMASGSPVVASDHPMFRGVVNDGQTGLVFRAGRPKALAAAVRRGWQDPVLYEQISARAAESYPDLGLETLWGDLLVRWVSGAPADKAWLHARSLAAATYR